jgi:hypothetical protein
MNAGLSEAKQAVHIASQITTRYQVSKSGSRKIVTILNLSPDVRGYCRIPDV